MLLESHRCLQQDYPPAELGNGRLCFAYRSKLNYADTLASTMLKENLCFIHLASRLEQLDQILVGSGPGQILDKNLLTGLSRW